MRSRSLLIVLPIPAIGSLLVALLLIMISGCSNPADMKGGNGAADMSETTAGPTILSFGTNVTRLTDGESVTFVAVLTDPSGLQNLVGGDLSSPDGKVKYAAFVAAQQGSYSVTLSFAQIGQATPFQFHAQQDKTFLATFYNTAGKSTTKQTTLTFYCDAVKIDGCAISCVDVNTDRKHCGMCGNSCEPHLCSLGKCGKWTCVSSTGNMSDCSAVCGAKTCAEACYVTTGAGSSFSSATSAFQSQADCLSYKNSVSDFGTCNVRVSGLTGTYVGCCCLQ